MISCKAAKEWDFWTKSDRKNPGIKLHEIKNNSRKSNLINDIKRITGFWGFAFLGYF